MYKADPEFAFPHNFIVGDAARGAAALCASICLMQRKALVILLWVAALCHAASVPAPKDHFGFAPGDDYKLADYGQISGYFLKLAAASDRIRVVEFGRSSEGRPMYVAFLSSPENLARLERYREISRRLALGQAGAEEARALAEEGRAIVWIDSGLHATEVAPAQQAPELAWRMVTGEDAETQAIRRNVILMQVPVLNPDGLDMVAKWYAKNLGTPYETAPLPWLYQKFAGHDNNRDWFMLNLPETRHATRLLFREWFPQIVYNQHQSPPFPARIFVPPYAEPLNPHIPAAVMEGINLIGSAMRERFARENKPGVISYFGFDAWWNGGLRSVPAFHNMHGILTETALNAYGTPRVYQAEEIRTGFANGMPAREPSVFYERPWLGGKWGTRDAVEYMLTADYALLNLVAGRRADYLLKAWQLARDSIEAGNQGAPYAYVVAPEQWDRSAAPEMLDRLAQAGIEVKRARAAFRAGARPYPEGTLVLLAGQPFRPYLMDLLEPQKYPEIRSGSTGPTKRPYDIAGWTLSMQMGVAVDRVDEPFPADLAAWGGAGATQATLDHRDTHSFLAVAAMLERGEKVTWAADGAINAPSSKPAWELRRPRVAVYQPWTPNADEGWTEWVLDHFRVPYALLHNTDLAQTDWKDRFDTILFASESAASILHGVRRGETGERAESRPTRQRPEYEGGIGIAGLAALDAFVRAGGTLVALDAASELPLQFFPIPVRNTLPAGTGESGFYCPGSLLRMEVDGSHPLAFGMPKEAIAFSTGGQAFDTARGEGEQEVQTVARFASRNLLASGWVSGDKAVLGKAALVETRHGKGRIVLFGFRPQFRAQPYGTFRLLLNAVYLGSARNLRGQ